MKIQSHLARLNRVFKRFVEVGVVEGLRRVEESSVKRGGQ